MLTFSPLKRYTVEQCIAHPYFEGLHDPEQEPTADGVFDYSYDESDISKEKLRSLIYEQMYIFIIINLKINFFFLIVINFYYKLKNALFFFNILNKGLNLLIL